jgi:glycosyltransferase involved in cell wall biosynthesis
MSPSPEPVSVVATVFNEGPHVERLLASLAAQTRAADELVIVDGGSTDNTAERLRAAALDHGLPLKLLCVPGANISAGRNAAIDAAQGPIIACTDAGVRLTPEWLAQLTAPFATGAQLVAGFFAPDPASAFETALGATTLPEVAEVDAATFLPSSRSVAFRKDAWARAGGYPEWLDYCEDLVFDFRVLADAGPAVFAPEALVLFRPRASLGAFCRQYYRYARGDGKAGLWAGRHAIRYAAYAVGAALALVAVRANAPLSLLAGLALIGGLAAMLRRPNRRLVNQWGRLTSTQRLAAALWVPVIRISGDCAKMVGYPVGLLWRWRHRPPAWRPRPSVGRL